MFVRRCSRLCSSLSLLLLSHTLSRSLCCRSHSKMRSTQYAGEQRAFPSFAPDIIFMLTWILMKIFLEHYEKRSTKGNTVIYKKKKKTLFNCRNLCRGNCFSKQRHIQDFLSALLIYMLIFLCSFSHFCFYFYFYISI